MTQYVVTPLEETGWRVGAEEFADGLRDRWPGVRVGLGSVEGSTMAVEAVIPLAPSPRELGVALSGTGQAVTLDPADAEAAAEFAVWYVERFLPDKPGIYLIEPGSTRTVELTDDLTPEALLARIT